MNKVIVLVKFYFFEHKRRLKLLGFSCFFKYSSLKLVINLDKCFSIST